MIYFVYYMSKFTTLVLVALGLVIMATAVNMPEAKAAGCAPFLVASGGTGNCALKAGFIPFGAGTSAIATSTGLSWNTTTNNLTFTYGSTTALTVSGTLYSALASTSNLTVSNLGNTGTNCLQISNQGVVSTTGAACAGGGFSYPFIYATTFNTLSAGTSTPLWLQGSPFSLFASSTSILDQASTTQLSAAAQTFYINSTGEIQGKDVINSWSGVISPTHAIALGTGTTTTWTASTTGSAYSPYIAAPFIGTLRQVTCLTDSSFVGVNIKINGTSVAPSYFVASTTGGIINFTGSNTFTKGQKILADFGTTTTSGALSINCTVLVTEIP